MAYGNEAPVLNSFSSESYRQASGSPPFPIKPHYLCWKILNIENDYFGCVEFARQYAQKQHSQTRANVSFDEHGLDTHVLPAKSLSARLLAKIDLCKDERWDSDDIDDAAVKFILAQYAPQGLLSGALLQNFCNASNCHERVASLVHAIHAAQVGNGKLEKNHSVLFRQLLENHNLHFPNINSDYFTKKTNLLASSWGLPAYRLSLSLFPQQFEAEILGAMLFDVAVSIPQPIRLLASHATARCANSNYFVAKSTVNSALLTRAVLAIETYLAYACHVDSSESLATKNVVDTMYARMLDGFVTSARLLEEWSNELRILLTQGYLHPKQEMVRLVKRKGKFAVGYHSKLKMGQVPFDEAIVNDAGSFVHQLGQSRWVTPGSPESSLLLSKLIAFGGPMFRVFSDTEVAVIRQWISSLPTDSAGALLPLAAETSTLHEPMILFPNTFQANKENISQTPAKQAKQACVRTMYYQLLNIERHHNARIYASEFASAWLARSAIGMLKDDAAIPFTDYSHQKLREWFEAKALDQARSYVGPQKNIEKLREEVIDEAIQLCPMILIDGAWLQKWGGAGFVETKIGAILFEIYSDELGNGDVQLNHPNIYRDLMRQMEVDLPDFRTSAFSHWTGFHEDAFQVPVFWLSLSLFPRRFLPETLGLNLAMELSGVGGAYKTAHDELRHYGFSTLFVDLHNTIDNVSTGHSALALEAIEDYMDEAIQAGDRNFIAERWRRIWIGFRALSPRPKNWLERIKNLAYPY